MLAGVLILPLPQKIHNSASPSRAHSSGALRVPVRTLSPPTQADDPNQNVPDQLKYDYNNWLDQSKVGDVKDWAGGKLYRIAEGSRFIDSLGIIIILPKDNPNYNLIARNNPNIAKQWSEQYGFTPRPSMQVSPPSKTPIASSTLTPITCAITNGAAYTSISVRNVNATLETAVPSSEKILDAQDPRALINAFLAKAAELRLKYRQVSQGLQIPPAFQGNINCSMVFLHNQFGITDISGFVIAPYDKELVSNCKELIGIRAALETLYHQSLFQQSILQQVYHLNVEVKRDDYPINPKDPDWVMTHDWSTYSPKDPAIKRLHASKTSTVSSCANCPYGFYQQAPNLNLLLAKSMAPPAPSNRCYTKDLLGKLNPEACLNSLGDSFIEGCTDLSGPICTNASNQNTSCIHPSERLNAGGSNPFICSAPTKLLTCADVGHPGWIATNVANNGPYWGYETKRCGGSQSSPKQYWTQTITCTKITCP